jgi:hypothetical protein
MMAAGCKRYEQPIPVPAADRYADDLRQQAADTLLIGAVYDKLAATGDVQMAEQLLQYITRQQQALSSMKAASRDHVVEMHANFLHGKQAILRSAHAMVTAAQSMHNRIQTFQITEPMWQ